MKEFKADYYDNHYGIVDVYQIDVTAEKSPYAKLYFAVEELLTQEEAVFELGCGVGQLAEMLLRKNYNYIGGVDFSSKGIEMSRERCKDYFVGFEVKDLTNYKVPDFDTYICLEVLEHVVKDLQILNNLPKGKRLILSVPTFMCRAHVRCFKTEEEVRERYGFLNIINIQKIAGIWLIEATS